jgi:hypothetical protein
VDSEELEDRTDDTEPATTEDKNAAVANAHSIVLSIQEQGRTIESQGTTLEAFQQPGDKQHAMDSIPGGRFYDITSGTESL